MGSYLYFLLILACPLMMVFMMRHGGHGGHGHAQGHRGGDGQDHRDSSASLDELRRQREKLDSEIESRSAEEQTRVGGDR